MLETNQSASLPPCKGADSWSATWLLHLYGIAGLVPTAPTIRWFFQYLWKCVCFPASFNDFNACPGQLTVEGCFFQTLGPHPNDLAGTQWQLSILLLNQRGLPSNKLVWDCTEVNQAKLTHIEVLKYSYVHRLTWAMFNFPVSIDYIGWLIGIARMDHVKSPKIINHQDFEDCYRCVCVCVYLFVLCVCCAFELVVFDSFCVQLPKVHTPCGTYLR